MWAQHKACEGSGVVHVPHAGLLGFPPRELQFRFLCGFTPAFYIRQRDYSKSVSVSPFIINYSGCIFREYPGPWQARAAPSNSSASSFPVVKHRLARPACNVVRPQPGCAYCRSALNAGRGVIFCLVVAPSRQVQSVVPLQVLTRATFAWVQVMLRQDNGQYACIAEDARRYNLGAAKEELMAAMGLDTEAEGSAMQFLRRGYKVQAAVLHLAPGSALPCGPVSHKKGRAEGDLNPGISLAVLVPQRSTWWEDAVDAESTDAWRR